METLTISDHPQRHPDTAFREVGEDGGLVVLPGRSEVKVLNQVGIKIFSLLDGEHSRESIVRAVVEDFDISEDQASADLHQFLQELDSNGMLAAGSESVSSGGSG